MSRLLAIGALAGLAALLTSSSARRWADEAVRDLSDRALMLLLRGTSGFAADVERAIQEEERERRTRWR